MNWYVLRVDINRCNKNDSDDSNKKPTKDEISNEEKVLEILKERLNRDSSRQGLYKLFIPKKKYPHTKGGKLLGVEEKICFPGYVFIETEKDSDFFLEDTRLIISGINEAHFFLYYSDNVTENGQHFKREYAMRENEKSILKEFMDDDFGIDSSEGFMEGDKVKITSGPFVGWEGNIKKLNRRRMTAVIDLGLFGGRTDITIMLEIIEKI